MRTPLWKRLLARVQAALTAAALAEEGDVDTARRIATANRTERGKAR